MTGLVVGTDRLAGQARVDGLDGEPLPPLGDLDVRSQAGPQAWTSCSPDSADCSARRPATVRRLSIVLVMVLWLFPMSPARSVATSERLPTTSSSKEFLDARADETVCRFVTSESMSPERDASGSTLGSGSR